MHESTSEVSKEEMELETTLLVDTIDNLLGYHTFVYLVTEQQVISVFT